ncbi:hypothetical protein OROMI_022019 [Orobanche minor]
MPLPWKKVKSTRISQMVNDHFHKSQKRRDGSSLVVETGFPTSLVDLFIKNREKLKNPSNKKRHNPPTKLVRDVNDSLITGPNASFHSISPLITVSPLQSPSLSPSRLPLPSEGASGTLVSGSSHGLDERECGARACADANKVLLVVLKMFVVVVLTLGTKRLTVGITLSAFLLFFLECAGKYARSVLKPCSGAKRVLKSMLLIISRPLLRFNEVRLDVENAVEVSMPELEQKCHVSTNRGSEFENHMVDEIQPDDEIIGGPCYKRSFGYQEIESVMIGKEESSSTTCEVADLKRKSRKAKIKSKMKKFVSNKLRSSRRERESRIGVDIVKEDTSIFLNDVDDDDRGSDNSSESSSVSLRPTYKENDNISALRTPVRVSDITEGGLDWRYLVHTVIVLAGLIRGRAFGVLLTVSWFLLLKLVRKLPRPAMKVPIVVRPSS